MNVVHHNIAIGQSMKQGSTLHTRKYLLENQNFNVTGFCWLGKILKELLCCVILLMLRDVKKIKKMLIWSVQWRVL